jgi:hypothetical protein
MNKSYEAVDNGAFGRRRFLSTVLGAGAGLRTHGM